MNPKKNRKIIKSLIFIILSFQIMGLIAFLSMNTEDFLFVLPIIVLYTFIVLLVGIIDLFKKE